MARLVNNFAVTCRQIINNNELVKVDYISTRPENCNCDFRVNIFSCKGEPIYRIATWILVIYSIILGCVSMYLLYYRVCIVGQSIFLRPSKFRGILRPRPQETFNLICCTYTTLHAIHLLIKLFDGYSNILWAELYLDILKLVPYAIATLYPISIIYSTPNVDQTAMRWTPNKYLIDIVGFSLMIFPFCSNIPIAFYTGYYADKKDIKMADYFFKLHYIMWSFWCFVLLVTLLIFWYKLINILNHHMKLINNRRNRMIIEDTWKLERLKGAVRNDTQTIPLRVFRKSGSRDSATNSRSMSLQESNDDIITSTSMVNNEFYQPNKSDKQIIRYGRYWEDTNNSRFSNKYSINSMSTSGKSSTSLGYTISERDTSPTSDVFSQRDLIDSYEGDNMTERMDDDDDSYNLDRKEWLAEKPKRIHLKKMTL
ncbi:18312_t:CDS:2 [Funneliformis geosporum]|uniref:8885_t:CDS:1 n=1 Tax=Funneliformis geosporum TaxID=1117311 RepID=A0A9W4SHK2_9GLOM|nr:18312_t:CDS:2 [Funneliformis geosporum]CAI2167317.1 8885_t:CDS:2 [Funneliformis geosporum]